MTDPTAQEKIAQALRGIWISSRATLEERISVLTQAGQALAAGTLDDSLRQQAESAAHKLAGVLGTFGMPRGSALASQLEQALGNEKSNDRHAEVQQWLVELREEMAAQDRRCA
ncbi:Hpt domain-containing protein [Silvibacterium dinghuense]|uniref:Hpt domain-containing protein n=1 Tax=Silvibacterium dinghuense TaxID=1560006 RepID=A0A4Q1SGY6_9BACT|nr:Hpt domain-containing protein [Silvibacterium dinghuense]RXS96784.1 Hpt domain-containing protein [Silvibacterium dinghuense]GGG93626.1 hypothetical protein GCM10011586_05480 [Silvibacterium dinghuense]